MLLKESIRYAGAQLPVSGDIQYNKKEIFKALDWAKENEVDHLLTPEGSLSGYGPKWTFNKQELFDALKEVEDKQKQSGVSLHLGTCHQEHEEIGDVYRNQIRHYNEFGDLYSTTNKICLVGIDVNSFPGKEINTFKLPYRNDRDYKVCGLICNDMWQWEGNKGLNCKVSDISPDVILHATNGVKHDPNTIWKHFSSEEVDYDKSHVRKVFEKYHRAYLEMTSIMSSSIIVTVDSCVPWDWMPDDENISIDTYRTSSPSGVVSSLGWLTEVKPNGRQYFYHDIDTMNKERDWKIVNSTVKNTVNNVMTLNYE